MIFGPKEEVKRENENLKELRSLSVEEKNISRSPNPKLMKKPTVIEQNMIEKIMSTIRRDSSSSKQNSNFSRISNINMSSIGLQSLTLSKVKVPTLSIKTCECASVLVVDDQIINRMILVEYGTMLEIKSDEAENGKIAYQMYKSSLSKEWWNGYKAIFMDLNMPVLDGINATSKILAEETSTPKPKIIAITAFWSDEEKEKWFNIGMSDFKMKPVNFDAYFGIIKNL